VARGDAGVIAATSLSRTQLCIDRPSRVAMHRTNQKTALRISGGDSRKKPVFASDDETRSPSA
jgi:hypothetical protein